MPLSFPYWNPEIASLADQNATAVNGQGSAAIFRMNGGT